MTAAWNPVPAASGEIQHDRDIYNAFEFRLLIEEVGLDPIFMVPADGSLLTRRLQ